jgi:murein DD-endopeptidase MepM/ murein hydrolase activator NlpD
MSRHRTTAAALLILLATGIFAGTASAAVPRLIFPVVGKVSYTDDFGAPRWQGVHEGNDIMARKKSKVVAVEPGRVVKYTSSRAAGCMLYLYGRSGTKYMYIHLNNDATLRNDNRGGCKNGIAYAPGLASNQQVTAGQLVGYVGDSGDANGIAPHLHFELHPNGRKAVSPYAHLNAALHHLYPRPRANVDVLRLRIQGKVVRVRDDLDPVRVRIRVGQIRMSNGWILKPARDVTLTVQPEAVLRRAVAEKAYAPASLSEFGKGTRVTAFTTWFAPTVASARAPNGHLVVADLLIRRK